MILHFLADCFQQHQSLCSSVKALTVRVVVDRERAEQPEPVMGGESVDAEDEDEYPAVALEYLRTSERVGGYFFSNRPLRPQDTVTLLLNVGEKSILFWLCWLGF